MKQRARIPAQLSEPLHKRLSAYALGASAAGVGVLALAQPAEARIVYTPAHVRIGPGGDVGSYTLRFNGQRAFSISFFSDAASSHSFWSQVTIASAASNFTSNQIMGYPHKNGFGWASALRNGVKIGSKDEGRNVQMAFHKTYGNHTTLSGPWANGGKGVTGRYAGLKFFLNGKIHYGWARMNVEVKGRRISTTTLTGYAYETIPNKPIIAGRTHGKDEATLGHLATGASAIPAWRVKTTAATAH